VELQEERLPEFTLDHGVVEFLVGGELLAFFAGKLREGAARNALVDVQPERVDLREPDPVLPCSDRDDAPRRRAADVRTPRRTFATPYL